MADPRVARGGATLTLTPDGAAGLEIFYLEAIRQALFEEMERDPRVFVLGQDVGVYGGAFKVTEGLQERFGKERVLDTPLSEEAIVGGAIGAAMRGMRPVAEMQFIDFISRAFDLLTNFAAKNRYRTGVGVPMVVRGPCGGGVHGGPFHSQNRRSGADLTIVTYGAMVWTALEAAEILERDGVSAEVLDLRTLLPLDEEAILASVRRTGKCLVLHEDTRTGGLGAEIAATLSEKAFEWLDGPILRVTAPDTPVPYSPPLEEAFLPNVNTLLAAARKLVRY